MKTYIQDIKNAFGLFRRSGRSVYAFVLVFWLLQDYVIIPLLDKLQSLLMSTTPDGFISNANFKTAFLKSPWILPAGILLLAAYAFLALWQVSGIFTGIGYAFQGKAARLRDLFVISFRKTLDGFRKGNRLILLYIMLLLPFTGLMDTNDLFASFTIPEYINDFILSKIVLSVLFLLLFLTALFFALRWFYALPAFFISGRSFREARGESGKLTRKNWFLNLFRLLGYSILEFVRLGIVPLLVICVPLLVSYIGTSGLQHSVNLFTIFGSSIAMPVVKILGGVFVKVSVLCFITADYAQKRKMNGEDMETALPELKGKERKAGRTAFFAQLLPALVMSLIITGTYLLCINYAQDHPDYLLNLFTRTEIIAHKGYSSKAPENTMPAFELADQCEAVDYIELDVWTSKDGIPVVIHNGSIKDATGIEKNVYDCTYEELQTYPAPYSMDAVRFADARIPALEEVLAAYADNTPILIEIKGNKQDSELPAKVAELMEKYGCTDTSLVQSGDINALKAVKEVNPDIQCGLILAMVTGNYYDIPYVDFFSVEHSFVSYDLVQEIHKRGKKIFVWTVNYDESASKLVLTGVDGIITDYPETIHQYVSDGNQIADDALTRLLNDRLSQTEEKEGIAEYISGSY